MRLHPFLTLLCALGALLSLTAGGCSTLTRESDADVSPLLSPASMPPGSVALDLAFLRVPARDDHLHMELWKEVDEQQLPVDVRRRLMANGIRAGVVGTQLPEGLRTLLDSEDSEGSTGPQASEAWQECRRMHVQPASRGEIIASNVYPSLTALFNQEGRVSGHTYREAQCMLALEVFPQDDGRVRLQFVPEIQYGQAHQRYVGGEGVYRLVQRRDSETFDTLHLTCLLSPGESLLLAATPEAAGLGRYFFTDPSTGEQRLLLVRLSQTQASDVFTPHKLSADGEPE